MNYTSISIKELKKISQKWADDIRKDYSPDILVYVAKAGFLVGYEIASQLKIPLMGVETIRPTGNGIKDKIAPIVRRLPLFVRNSLISLELKSGIHKKNSKRKVRVIDNISKEKANEYKRVLVVDDSIDTGASIKAVVDCLGLLFSNAEIRLAGLNVWDKSKEVIKIDYYVYKNTIIRTPMSKDSREYDIFISMYRNYTKTGKVFEENTSEFV